MTSVAERVCHLPYSMSPEEEFQGPNGDWFSIHRAIVFDSWLTWKDALPGHPISGRLDEDVAATITVLAQKIHTAHALMPEYRRLADTPFRVGRWWDPSATDAWSTGSKVLIRLEHYSAQRFASKLPGRLNLKAKAQSENWLVISLPEDASCDVHSLDYSRVVTAESA